MSNKDLRVMLETSLLVAAALILSLFKPWRMPQGGSPSLEMLPIFILAFRRGGQVGIIGGAFLGFLKLVLNPYILHPVQVLLDYPVPFAVLGVAGLELFRQYKMAGVLTGGLLRYGAHVVSGVVFFAQYAPEGTPALLYSLGYNASYLVIELVVVIIILHFLGTRKEILEPNENANAT